MYKVNENFLKLPGSYLFSNIAKKIASYQADINDLGTFTGDTEVIANGVFNESVYRSAPAFDLDIDGITIIA